MSKLPTEPGPFWWRARKEDDWQIVQIERQDDILIYRRSGMISWLGLSAWPDYYPVGEWVKAEPTEECGEYKRGFDAGYEAALQKLEEWRGNDY